MDQPAPRTTIPSAPRRRKLKNYLIDRRFQLRYAGYFASIALLVSAALGWVLWNTAKELLIQSRRNVESASAVVAEGRKVSRVVEMNIVQDPDYGRDPDLLKAFREGDVKYTERLELEQRSLETQAQQVERKYETSAQVLVAGLGLFVILVGLGGVLITHRVAGPVHKMKRLMGRVTAGHLPDPGHLRRGDELADFFGTFERMVRSLRGQHDADLQEIERTLARLRGKVDNEDLEDLVALRNQMRSRLG
ncbi:HAMP domain-containing protein [Myxococcota bacterium]